MPFVYLAIGVCAVFVIAVVAFTIGFVLAGGGPDDAHLVDADDAQRARLRAGCLPNL